MHFNFARHSFRTLVLVGAIVAPALWSSTCFASFPAPLSPLFMGVDPNSPDGCFGGGVLTTNSQALVPCGNPAIGYVFTTQVSGTSQIFMGVDPNNPDGCFGGGRYTTNTQLYACFYTGAYAYSTQVSGTVPLFVGVDPNNPDGCFGGGVFTTNPQLMQCGNTIAYVYPAIPGPTSATVQPLFIIGSVIYMPPGASGSFVQYGSNTTVGTTLSVEHTFTVDASATLDFGTSTDGESVTLGHSFSKTTSTSTDMQSSSMRGTKFTAPASNPINHDLDQIMLYLGVQSTLSTDYLGHITESFDFSQMASLGFPAIGYFAKVGCLNSSSSIYWGDECTSQRGQLAMPGWDIHEDSYPTILSADPFWDPNNQPPTLDPCRFKSVENEPSVPYEANAGVVPGLTNSNSLNITNTTTISHTYSVGFTTKGGIFDLSKLNVAGKLTYTDKSSTSNRTGNSDMSQFSITMPVAPYIGPASLNIYVDTIYKTFMFSFIPPPGPTSPHC